MKSKRTNKTTPVPVFEPEPETVSFPNGLHTVEIISTTFDEYREPGGRKYREVTVLVAKSDARNKRRFEGYRTFVLNSAWTVADLRRFFALFDFPIFDERDLPDACFRARHGTLRVRVRNEKDGTQLLEFLERMPDKDQPDSADALDIWNHRLHWTLRREETRIRCLGW